MKLSEIPNMKKFGSVIKILDKNFNDKHIPLFRKTLLTKFKDNDKTVNENEIYEILKREIVEFNQKEKINKLLSTTNSTHTNSFDWTKSIGFTLNEAKELRLIKGVAMSSGTKKDGVIESQDNIAFGTGTMAAYILNGMVVCDIDHFKDGLPKDEYSDYPIEKINETYPPATMLAVGLGRNIVGNKGEEKVQTEFLAICSNETVYDMIGKGEFVGCSTEEIMRNKVCKEDGTDCTAEGSHLPANTLLLKGVPNSDSTWVAQVDKNDIGTILSKEDETNHISNSLKSKLMLIIKNRYLNHVTKNEDQIVDITKYYNDKGEWKNGVDSINEFLTIEKKVNAEKAKLIADYLFVNPGALNEVHLTFFSADDLTAWFDNLNFNKIIKEQNAQIIQINTQLRKDNAVQFGQGEVEYGDYPEGSKCYQCRWFTSFESDIEEIPNSIGSCNIVAGDIMGQKGCNKFEAIPGGSAPETIDADTTTISEALSGATSEPGNLAHEEPDADGNCPDTHHLGEVDGVTMCIPNNDEMTNVDPIAPNEDGSCNDGFEIGEIDGTSMCIPTQDTIDAFDAANKSKETLTKEQINKLLSKNKNSIKATALTTDDPKTAHNEKIISINKEIHALKEQLNKLPMNYGLDKDAKNTMRQRKQIKNQISELQQKKRTLSITS